MRVWKNLKTVIGLRFSLRNRIYKKLVTKSLAMEIMK